MRDLLGGGGIQRAVEGDDAAERADRIAFQRAAIGLEQVLTLGDAAGIGVLDDGDGGPLELGHQLESGVRVVQVVVAQLLALKLGRGRDAGPGIGAADIEGGRLMGFSP